MKPTCEELAADIASGRIERLGWLDRLRHRLHAWLCPPCRQYQKQVDSIGTLARQRADDGAPCPEALEAMKRRCLERVKGPATRGPADDAEVCPDSD
ncbi:MAG: hypothetical protein AAGM22_09365 [Acidobacteriota bacterium]